MSAGKVTTYVVGREMRNLVTWWLPTIGGTGLLVYVYVAHRANQRTGAGCFETVKHIAQALGLPERRVRSALHTLESAGLLHREPGGQHFPNTYRPVLPVRRPDIAPLQGLNILDLSREAGLKRSDLAKRGSQTLHQRHTNRKESTESDTARVRDHLYATLARMNGTAPTPHYGRDGQQARAHVQAHGVDAVLAKVEAFRAFWPNSWIARKTPGAHATAPNFWKLFDEIPTATNTSTFVPLSELLVSGPKE